jgi:hypothetical protein
MNEALVLALVFVVLLLAGVPIVFTIGLASLCALVVSLDPAAAATVIAQRLATGLDSFALLAIPFFILAGNLMNRGGIAHRLIALAKVVVGRLPGGLAYVNILANMLFGAISGSAAAAAAANGGFMAPLMKKEGFDKNFSAAVNISSATTGLLIPPSNVMVVYSLASGGVSIAALFVAGYIPGLMLGLGETRDELLDVFADLVDHGVDYLTLGQYLQPTLDALPVERYVPPEEFVELGEIAKSMGFKKVASGPLVRSSYHARDMAQDGRVA